jgi:hypothetical protein
MAVLSKGTNFADGDQVTSSTLDALVDSATFVSGASGTTDDSSLEVNGSGRLQVKALGIGTSHIASDAVTAAKIPNGAITVAKLSTGAPSWNSLGNVTVTGSMTCSVADSQPVVSAVITSLTTSNFPALRADCYSGSVVGYGLVDMRRARGTSVSPTAVQSADILGLVRFLGHNGSSMAVGARINSGATETFSGSQSGSYLAIETALTGATAMTQRMYFSPNGSIGVGTSSPNASAIVHLASTTQGFRPPALTTAQRDAIATPLEGLMLYNSTTKKLNFYNGAAWEAVTSAV